MSGVRSFAVRVSGHVAKLSPTLRLYDLRHSCAVLLLSAGENPKVVSERLGHTSIVLTLDSYSHVLRGSHVRIMPGAPTRYDSRKKAQRHKILKKIFCVFCAFLRLHSGLDAKDDLDWFGRSCWDAVEVLAVGARGAAVWRNVSVGNDDGQPDRVLCNRCGVLSD